MDFDDVLKIAPVVGVIIGMGIYQARQRTVATNMAEKIRNELASADSLSLPELVTRLGFKDGFINRGKVVNVLNPMVMSGELDKEEPPGTTMKNRLSVMRFRLRSRGVQA
jgi:hypothetical protein